MPTNRFLFFERALNVYTERTLIFLQNRSFFIPSGGSLIKNRDAIAKLTVMKLKIPQAILGSSSLVA
jgi:hypothetical protein